MSKINNEIEIPMDIYESNDEIVIIVPLGGVQKNSIEIFLEKSCLYIHGQRKNPDIKENLVVIQQDCYWGDFNKTINLPQNIYFEKIHSKLTSDNILIIVVPKILIPEKLKVEVEYLN